MSDEVIEGDVVEDRAPVALIHLRDLAKDLEDTNV